MDNSRFAASQRLQAVQTPIIPEVAALIEQTPGTISLGQGVVYYPPPDAALKKARNFENTYAHHIYSDVTGIPHLRHVIAEKLLNENAIDTTSNYRIVVTAGSNMGFLNAVLAITEPGDEVILLKPYYFNHEMAITMTGCRTVSVDCDEHYQPVIENIKAAIGPKTRAIVTVSPNNPSGAVYPESTLTEINHLCRDKGLFHVSDEAYEYFVYEDETHFSPASITGAEKYTISLFSLSKAYGFASWRIGYMVIPPQLELAVKKVQDTNLICASRICQEAAIAALETGKEYCQQQGQQIKLAREHLYTALQSLDDRCTIPKTTGAFYFLLHLNTELSGMDVVKTLISQYRIATIPGETFGLDTGCYLRVAYGALGMEVLTEATDRLTKGIKNIIKKY